MKWMTIATAVLLAGCMQMTPIAKAQRVPNATHDKYNKFGLCADEFLENDHIPPQLYSAIDKNPEIFKNG